MIFIKKAIINATKLMYEEKNYNNLSGFYFFVSLALVPAFYTYIIFPFYNSEDLYKEFLVKNTLFFISVLSCYYLLTVLFSFRLKRFSISKYNSRSVLYVLLFLLTLVVCAYIVSNIFSLGFWGFYNGCHYCGVEPLFGFGILRIILFDFGAVLAMLLPITLVAFGKKSLLFIFQFLIVLSLLFYFFIGSYRNQILPIVFSYLVIFIYQNRNAKKIYLVFLLSAPIVAISMAFFYYFGGEEDATYTLYEYFSKNEFFSNYNNFIIYSSGFELELPFSGASYIGPLLHRIDNLIDTGFQTPARQMADFMGTGIGYGFSPLLESLLNFGDFYLLGAFFIAVNLYFFRLILTNIDNQLVASCFFGLILFYIFNIFRVDFTAAFNIFFHKAFLFLFFLSLVDFKKI